MHIPLLVMMIAIAITHAKGEAIDSVLGAAIARSIASNITIRVGSRFTRPALCLHYGCTTAHELRATKAIAPRIVAATFTAHCIANCSTPESMVLNMGLEAALCMASHISAILASAAKIAVAMIGKAKPIAACTDAANGSQLAVDHASDPMAFIRCGVTTTSNILTAAIVAIVDLATTMKAVVTAATVFMLVTVISAAQFAAAIPAALLFTSCTPSGLSTAVIQWPPALASSMPISAAPAAETPKANTAGTSSLRE
jgi:hypothetical protein